MSKRYVPCKTVEECIAGYRAGVLYWYASPMTNRRIYQAGGWDWAPKSEWLNQLEEWNPAVLVDTDEEE